MSRIGVFVLLVASPVVAYASPEAPIGVGDVGAISWPAAIAWAVYGLKSWAPELRVVITHKDRDQS